MLTQLIDARASSIAARVRAQLLHRTDIQERIQQMNLSALRDNQRAAMQTKLIEEAKRLQKFENEEINLSI